MGKAMRRAAAATLAVVAATTASTTTAAVPTATAAAAPAPTATGVVESSRVTLSAAAQGDPAGPHSPARRQAAAPKVSRLPGAQVLDVDFGDVDLGRRARQFRAPMRGVLVVPDRSRNAPLVVVSHLRMPGCTNDVLAYPCPKGTKELRLDRGMTYLGVDLARQGYAVLIPDLAPLWIGSETSGPYDQIAGWQKIVGGLRDRVAAANRGRSGFGVDLRGRVDTRRSALVVHSRSAYIVEPAVRAWRRTSPVTSVFAYGPAATAEDPAPPDVPYLVALGGADGDVNSAPSHWLSRHTGVSRRSPLALATVPGLGHSYVNRTLSRAGLDDRKACDRACPNARAHELFLQNAVSAWLRTTYRGPNTPAAPAGAVPMTADAPLPATLGGRAVQWIATSNSPTTTVAYDSSALTRGVGAVRGGTVTACRYYEPMDPTPHRDRCADSETGVIEALGPVLRVGLTPTGGARLRIAPVREVRQVAITVNPTGSREDRRPGTSLRVTLVDSAGGRHRMDISRLSEALRDRRTTGDNGTYTPTTVRLPVTTSVRGATIVGVELTGGDGSGTIDVRRVDLLRS